MPRDERETGWRMERRREWARRGSKGWRETNNQIRGGLGKLDRERDTSTRVKVNEGVCVRERERCLGGARETIRLRRNSMNEGQDSELEGKRRKRENEME